MYELTNRSLSRRHFLKGAPFAAGVSALSGNLLSCRGSSLPYDRTLRDRLWMWGHDAGSLKKGYGIGGENDMRPGEAIRYMGIPNVCMVRFTGTPLPPFDDYVKQLVEQVLFTSPGERVNLPDFGSGLLQLPFAPNSIEMAAATQVSVQAALQKWLGSYVKVRSVVATAQEAVLTVTVAYSLLNSDVTQVQTFVKGTVA